MAEMHKCGQGWAYCDGNCATCATNIPTYTTTSTDDDFRRLGKNTDGKPMGGSGAKTEMSGFVTRIEPGKKEPYTVIFTTAGHEKYLHMKDECRKMIGHAKPMTNADKCIRNATDEELARFIAKAQADILRMVGRALNYPGDLVRDCDLEDAADDWLIWLKQEVADEN